MTSLSCMQKVETRAGPALRQAFPQTLRGMTRSFLYRSEPRLYPSCSFPDSAAGVTVTSAVSNHRSRCCFLSNVNVSLSLWFSVCRVMEYSLDGHNASLSAIRTVRVLRPLRAINRVPSKVLTESTLNSCHPLFHC